MRFRARRVRIAFLLGSLASTGLASAAIQARQQPTEQIERTVTGFLTAFSNRDFERFLPFFSDAATVFFPPSAAAPTGLVRGRVEIERTFRAIFEKYPPRSPGPVTSIRPQDLLTEELNGVAVVTFHLGSETARQRRTLVMRRFGDEWKIVHLHGSASSTQP